MTTKNTWPTELTPEVYQELVKPFGPDELEVRVGATTGQDNEKRGLAIPYTDANSIRNRLDRIVGPTNWSFEPSEWRTYAPQILSTTNPKTGNVQEVIDGQRVVVWGTLKVLGVTRIDCGEAYKEDESFKSAVTDAFKRAATAFGFGRELYALPRNVWAEVKPVGKSWVFVDSAAVRHEIADMCAQMASKTDVAEAEKQPQIKKAPADTQKDKPGQARNGGPSPEQLGDIARLRKQYFGSDEDGDTIYRNQMEKNYGVRSSKDLTVAQANGLLNFLNSKVQAGEVYNPGHSIGVRRLTHPATEADPAQAAVPAAGE